jgi:hypothetical protein
MPIAPKNDDEVIMEKFYTCKVPKKILQCPPNKSASAHPKIGTSVLHITSVCARPFLFFLALLKIVGRGKMKFYSSAQAFQHNSFLAR